jgi:hypothetical protein
MPKAATLRCELFSATPLDPRAYANTLYAMLDTWRFRPAMCGDSEPLRTPWGDRDAFRKLCMSCASTYFGPVIIKFRSPSFYMMVTHVAGPKAKAHTLSIYSCKPKDFGGAGAPYLIELADMLFTTIGFTYGFACVDAEYYDQNTIPATYRDGATARPMQVVGMEWPDCVPGFYWCNYFGDEYFAQGFGGHVRSLPSATVLPNGVRLLRSASALDWDTPEERGTSAELVEACGKDWFFSKQTGMPTKALRTDKSAFRLPMRLEQ